MELVERRRMQTAFVVGCVVVAAVSIVAAVAVSTGAGLTPNGLGINLF
jgi:pyrimidine deaminase RibD-like protein